MRDCGKRIFPAGWRRTLPIHGLAVRWNPEVELGIPGILRAFYQAPPILTISGPLLQYITGVQQLGFIPLHGERDEEHQYGVTIPFRGDAGCGHVSDASEEFLRPQQSEQLQRVFSGDDSGRAHQCVGADAAIAADSWPRPGVSDVFEPIGAGVWRYQWRVDELYFWKWLRIAGP